jgi:hypothetical protein
MMTFNDLFKAYIKKDDPYLSITVTDTYFSHTGFVVISYKHNEDKAKKEEITVSVWDVLLWVANQKQKVIIEHYDPTLED